MEWVVKFGAPFRENIPACHYKDPREGIEFMSTEGATVLAMADGIILRAGYDDPKNPRLGEGLRLKQLVSLHGFDGWTLIYGHLYDLKVYLGDTVRRGQKIALAGPKTTVRLYDKTHLFRPIEFQYDPDEPP